MKTIVKKALGIFILIIAILFFLQSIFVIYFIGKFRECDKIKVTDNNTGYEPGKRCSAFSLDA